MAVYYKVLVYVSEGQRHLPTPLTQVGGNLASWAPSHGPDGAFRRFLWESEARDALTTFLHQQEIEKETGEVFYKWGEVVHVQEERIGAVVCLGALQESFEPPRAPEIVEEPQGTSNPFLEQGEALLAAAEACDLTDDSDHDDYHEAALWFYENAREFLDAVRERDDVVCERDRLDWLRMHPESCRAAKDCRNKKAPGYIHCAECLEAGNAGGYFDVYRSYYAQIYNDELEKCLKQFAALNPPEGSVRPPDPGSPRSLPSCPS